MAVGMIKKDLVPALGSGLLGDEKVSDHLGGSDLYLLRGVQQSHASGGLGTLPHFQD